MQLAAERLEQIAHFIKTHQHVRVSELSKHFGVSEPTIRRDLQRLEEMGQVRREHGGASSLKSSLPEEPVVQRVTERVEEKQRIGERAAQLVQDGETIFLGSGTTTQEVARYLHGKKQLTVITNALNIANQLAQDEEITLIVTGGVVRHSEASMIGYIVEQSLKELRADKVIISMRAVSVEEGLTNSNPLETLTDRVIIRFAREVILVADHSKFGHASSGFVAPITAVHKLITDEKTSPEIVKQLRILGVEVLLV
jgi:DeoR/GlpR family transcriptional regulator of sugar metabolism